MLGVALAQGVHLPAAEHGRRLGRLAHRHDRDVLLRVQAVGGRQRPRDEHPVGAHGRDADDLAPEIGDALDRALGRHRDDEDIALIRGVERLGSEALGSRHGEGLGACQGEHHFARRHVLDAVHRAGQRDQLHLEALFPGG